jgi:2',3'-cyclic-nucleotide 2'-phosphodiesterase (5'-nucleotidase family)
VPAPNPLQAPNDPVDPRPSEGSRPSPGESRLRWLPVLVVLGLVVLTAIVLFGALYAGRGEAVIVSINDVYRIEGVDGGTRGGLARVRALRKDLERSHPDLLLLHAGDFLFPSLLSETYGGGQMIEVMNRLDGRPDVFDPRFFITFGNHEFDRDGEKGAENLAKQIEDSEFRWLGSNLVFGDGFPISRLEAEGRLSETARVDSGGLRFGIFSLTTDVKAPDYVERFLDLQTTAALLSDHLRQMGAEVVVALTHLPIGQDRAILRELGADGPDLIIGGHEHQRHVEEIDGRWIVKADADARTAAVVHVRIVDGRPAFSVGYRFLGPKGPEPDPAVRRDVEGWIVRHDREVCEEDDKPAGCLSEELAKTDVPLVAEEIEIRKYETNLGDWVADQAREALGADVAFVNSGSLRLNQDLPAGPFTERNLRELFPYDNSLVKLEITGELLQQVVNRSIENWTGEGHFLQISGFAFRHDPATGQATDLTLLTGEDGEGGTTPIEADTPLTAVTVGYLREGEDGYACLASPSLQELGSREGFLGLVRERLQAAGEIAPKAEGRICNRQRGDRPCKVPEGESTGALTTASCAETSQAPTG